MQKVRLVFEELKQKYEQQKPKKGVPVIRWLPIGNSSSEDFNAHYSGGTVTIKAEGYLGAIHGLQRIKTGILSGHLVDFLGVSTPHFKLRPLWLDESIKVVLSEPAKIHAFCKKVLELGYNAVVVDQVYDQLHSLKALCTNLQSYGLKVIFKSSFLQNQKLEKRSPLNKTYSESIVKYLKETVTQNLSFDFLFWESHWQQPEFIDAPHADGLTLPEVVLREARLLESCLDKTQTLIFYVPAENAHAAMQCAKWMPRLADDLGQKTVLAFPAVAGDALADFLPPHPVWEHLRLRLETSSAPLMPLLNVGQVKQSEGLWPVLVHDLIDEYMLRCQNGHFSGILAIVNQLPGEGGVHDCNLWVASQAMWTQRIPAFLLMETWFSAHRPDWNYNAYSFQLRQIRTLSKQLGILRCLTHENNRDQLSNQECRLFAESILAQLHEIQSKLEKEERKRLKKSDKTTLWDYFTYFAFDARRMILHALQCFNVSIPNILGEDDLKESFWTEFSGKLGQSTRSNARVTFLELPQKGVPGSRMHMIYQENRLF